jgi:abhydrolase domain-containing protein 12
MGQSLGTGVASALVASLAAEGTSHFLFALFVTVNTHRTLHHAEIIPRALVLVAPFSSISSLLETYKLFNHIPLLGPFKRFPWLVQTFLKVVRTKFETKSIIRVRLVFLS